MPLSDGPFTHLEDNNAERIAAFQQRQAADFDARYADADGEYVVKRMPFHERLQRAQQRKAEQVEASGSTFAIERAKDESILILNEEDGDILPAQDYIQNDTGSGIKLGEEAWRNQEGERLADFGVDEEADFYDETDVGIGSDEDVPLAELIRRGHMK
jgi:palmitoyltransferase